MLLLRNPKHKTAASYCREAVYHLFLPHSSEIQEAATGPIWISIGVPGTFTQIDDVPFYDPMEIWKIQFYRNAIKVGATNRIPK